MSDIKMFSIGKNNAIELAGQVAALEKDLQQLIESHMETFLGVRFLATEYSTGKTHKGRIDSLGIDENGCPVIIEYKRHSTENVINQGLYYLDWLLDHQAEFQLLVMKQIGHEQAEAIEWGGTRLICIAADFNKFDGHAVQQINRNVELMRYKYFGDDLLLLELMNAQTASDNGKTKGSSSHVAQENHNQAIAKKANAKGRNDYHEARKNQASEELLALYELVCDFADSLGDEVQRKELKFYTALKRIKNFASVQVWAPQQNPKILIHLHLDPSEVDLEEGFSVDVTDKGHWGTGNLEVNVRNKLDFEKAKILIEKSYLAS